MLADAVAVTKAVTEFKVACKRKLQSSGTPYKHFCRIGGLSNQTCGRPRAVSWVFNKFALSLLAKSAAELLLLVATLAETCKTK
jgi:hypothetical protein